MIAIAGPIDADLLRVRHQYLTDSDLKLSAADIVAQLQVQPRHALRMLESLVVEGFVRRDHDGRYVRVHTGDPSCESSSSSWGSRQD
jgi:hypothetical protein